MSDTATTEPKSAIIEQPPQTTQAILAYGEREDVREIAHRLMSLHPAAQEVGQKGMQAVAQLAIMAGANPMPGAGEIYVWVDNKGKIVVFLGVAYYRRIASQKDTLMWAFDDGQPRPMTPEERERRVIAPNAVAAICEGLKLSAYQQLLNANVPWEAAQKMLKRTSYAVINHSEMFYQRKTQYHNIGDPVEPPHGRTWQWVAEKRAEIGLYRMLAMVDTVLTDALQSRLNEVLGFVGDHSQRRPAAERGWRDIPSEEIDQMFAYT